MEQNKISVGLELDTSEYNLDVKQALKIFETLKNNIEEKMNINIDSKEFQRAFDGLSKTAIKEITKIQDNINKLEENDYELTLKFRMAQDELNKAKKKLEDALGPTNIAVAQKEVDKAQTNVDKINQERELNAGKIDYNEGELQNVFNTLNKLSDLDFKIDTGSLQSILIYLQQIKDLDKEDEDDEERKNDELKEEKKNREEITKESRRANKEHRKSHSSMLSISSLIRRVGLSIRRQIVTQIASVLNPLNMMKKAFSYLTDTISPRLGATFKNIGNNLTEYFANSPLFKTMINQLLYIIKLLQDAFNVIAKLFGFRQIDLFKTSKKTAKEIEKSASHTVASFDEINDIGSQGQNDDNVPLGLGELDLKDQSQKIIDSINGLIDKFKNFFTTFDFGNLGQNLGKKFSDAILSIDWPGLARTLVAGITGMIDLAFGFLKGIDWGKLAKTISDTLLSALDQLNKWLDEIDWDKLAIDLMMAINDFVVNIDWNKIVEDTFKAVGKIIKGAGKLIGNLVAAIGVMLYDYFSKYITIDEDDDWLDIGLKIIDGILAGIIEALYNIGKWIYEHIFLPLWDGIKEAFGIHSPSTKMMEIGEQIVEGLKEGFGDVWGKVKEKWETLKTNISTKFNEIKTNINEKASSIIDNLKNTFSWDKVKNNINTMVTNIKNKFNDIKNFKFSNFTIKVGAKVDEFKNKVKKILNNDGVLGDLLGWAKSKISSAKTWVNSLDVGTGYVPFDQLAYIHQGEAVIPKKFNDKEYFGGTNDETNALLETLIDRVENLELSPYITVKDIGQASLNYINNKSRITGRSVI